MTDETACEQRFAELGVKRERGRVCRPAANEQSYCAIRLSLVVTDMISSRESEPEKEEF
jgi:hypothetical protein